MIRSTERGRAVALLLAILVSSCASCGRDDADRAYYAALEGEETALTRKEQIALLDQAIELAPERAWYWETRAIYRIDLQRFVRARADLDRAIELADRPYLRFLRGLVMCQSGSFAESIPEFDLAIEGQPENTQFYRGRSLAHAAIGAAQSALADAEVLVSRRPQWADSYYARGRAFATLGQYEAAIADFTESIQRYPQLVYPLHARAECYDRIGDSARAAADRAEVDRRVRRGVIAAYIDPFRY